MVLAGGKEIILMINKRNITVVYFIILSFIFSNCSESQTGIEKEYILEGNPIEEIVLFPGLKNPCVLEIKIKGNIDKGCIFYYSHYPFEIMNKIKLNGLTDKNIRADWYDNRCKILIKPEDKDTTGSIRFVFKLY